MATITQLSPTATPGGRYAFTEKTAAVVLGTPEDRIFHVQHESRTFDIEADLREFQIFAEPRTFTIH